jgi:hypothetical protein
MPAVSAPDLATLRTYPHKSDLYLIVQQPMYRSGGAWAGYLFAAQIDGAPAGTAGDLVASLTVDNAEVGGGGADVDIFANMTVFVGTNKGDHDKGIFYTRNGFTADAATTAIPIGASSDVVDVIEDDDWVVIIDEFRLWTRYPRVTEAGGDLTWYKDYDVLFTDLGGTAAARRQAELPAIPIMGPHRVAFIDLDSSVTFDFDWSDSYAASPGAAVDAWDSEGIRGATSGNWTSALENPGAQTYDGSSIDADNDISGLAGFRTWLILGTDQQDPSERFRSGIRYVFTLRRPGETVDGIDPPHAEPITDFSVSGLSGSYDDGGWRCTVTIFGSQAHEYEVWPGALVILFAEDWYGSTKDSIGPISGAENIVFIGRVADGSVRQDPETGDVTFDVLSAAGQARNRETFPVPIENDDAATEWYQAANLTVDRAAWFYLVWHTTLANICDWYWGGADAGGDEEIKAMDFLAGDVYTTLDTFYAERCMARVLCDRYERFKIERNLQLQAQGSGTTVLTVATGDWLDELQFRETVETQTSIVELGGVNYNAGLIRPYLCKAPGTVNRQKGRNAQNMAMAATDQATLNTLAGRWLAALNNRWPDNVFPFGNWRVFDIWPQEYIVASPDTVRHTFASDKFIIRRVGIEAGDGALFVTVNAELETGGVDGQTIVIPDELPTPVPPRIPFWPPQTPPAPDNDAGSSDLGRRIIGTNVGVFVTDNIGTANPVWYAVNNGFSSANDRYVYDIKRDPWHWWTSGGTERTLWAATKTGFWKHENFPYGTWVNVISISDIETNSPRTYAGVPTALTDDTIYRARMAFSAEKDERWAAVYHGSCTPSGVGQPPESCWVAVFDDDAYVSCTEMSVSNRTFGFGAVSFAPHGGANRVWVVTNYNYDNAGDSEARIYRSINAGGAWSAAADSIDANTRGLYTSLSIPYISPESTDQYLLWGRGGNVVGSNSRYRISTNGGTTWADLPQTAQGYSELNTGGQPEYIWLNTYRPDLFTCKWSNDRGVTYNLLPLNNAVTIDDSGCSFPIWNGGTLQSVVACNTPNLGLAHWVSLWENGRPAWVNKTGNLLSVAPTLATIFAIDRDSMGTA